MSYRSKSKSSKSSKLSKSTKLSKRSSHTEKCNDFMKYYVNQYKLRYQKKSKSPSNGRKRESKKFPSSIHKSLLKSCRKKHKKTCRKFLAKPNTHPITKRELKQNSIEQHSVQDFCVGIFGAPKKPFKHLKHEKTKVYV